jgi:multiple sugar transport system substrate-binding protein
MVCDWPGSHHLYISPETSDVVDRTRIDLLPTGPSGRRAAYAGCHSFAIPRTARNREGAARLVAALTSTAAQLHEARDGAIPVRSSALRQIREEASANPPEAHRWDLLTRTLDVMIMPPRFAAYPACEDALWRSIQRAIEGTVSPEEALADAARRIAALLGRERPAPQNVV